MRIYVGEQHEITDKENGAKYTAIAAFFLSEEEFSEIAFLDCYDILPGLE